jgi:hypothetical protein
MLHGRKCTGHGEGRGTLNQKIILVRLDESEFRSRIGETVDWYSLGGAVYADKISPGSTERLVVDCEKCFVFSVAKNLLLNQSSLMVTLSNKGFMITQ